MYDNLVDLKAQVDDLLEPETLTAIKINTIRTHSLKNDNLKKKKNAGPEKSKHKPRVPKEEIGFLGEYLTYLQLKETIENKDSIKWVSGYSQLCGVNPEGVDGLGYDLEYIPNGAKYPRYVEVKVSGRDDAFYITTAEVKFGELKKRNYEIFLIRNIENPTKVFIDRIQGLFDYRNGSFNDNDMFSVENENFILRFKKVDNKE